MLSVFATPSHSSQVGNLLLGFKHHICVSDVDNSLTLQNLCQASSCCCKPVAAFGMLSSSSANNRIGVVRAANLGMSPLFASCSMTFSGPLSKQSWISWRYSQHPLAGGHTRLRLREGLSGTLQSSGWELSARVL